MKHWCFLLVKKAHWNWKTFLGMLSSVRFLFRCHAVDLTKGTWGLWTFRQGSYLASLAAVPFLMFRSFCCTTNKPPTLRLLLWGKSTRSNQWLWCPRSFLLQDFLCVRIVARHTGSSKDDTTPPLHNWGLRCHKFGYLSFMNLQFLQNKPWKNRGIA